MTTSRKTFWLSAITISFGFNFLIFYRSVIRLIELRASMFHTGWTLGLAIYVGVMLACVWLVWRFLRDRLVDLLAILNLKQFSAVPRRVFGWLFFALVACGIPYIKFNFVIHSATESLDLDLVLVQAAYYWLVWWLVLSAVTIALVLLGISYELFSFYQVLGNFPLTLSWSERIRYYYAAFFFSKSMYGETFPLPTLHPTRYFFQSLTFLVSRQGAFWHRLGQGLFWFFTGRRRVIVLLLRSELKEYPL